MAHWEGLLASLPQGEEDNCQGPTKDEGPEEEDKDKDLEHAHRPPKDTSEL